MAAKELTPYRGQEIQEVEYRSKWDDLRDHTRCIKDGAVTLFERGVLGTFEWSRSTLMFVIAVITSLVWAPLLMFWSVGFKRSGGVLFERLFEHEKFKGAKARLKRNDYPSHAWNEKRNDQETVNKYDAAQLIPFVDYEQALAPVATATGAIDFVAILSVLSYLIFA